MFPASACGFHGVIGDGWVLLHPRSLDVAMAVREAADRGTVHGSLLNLGAAGPLAYVRTTKRLRQFGLALGDPDAAMPT